MEVMRCSWNRRIRQCDLSCEKIFSFSFSTTLNIDINQFYNKCLLCTVSIRLRIMQTSGSVWCCGLLSTNTGVIIICKLMYFLLIQRVTMDFLMASLQMSCEKEIIPLHSLVSCLHYTGVPIMPTQSAPMGRRH